MKKILLGLFVCVLFVGMTGVVSATPGDYCKVTGGGKLVDGYGNDMGISVSFTAQGTCMVTPDDEDYDVKGMVMIVDRNNLVKKHLDVIMINCDEFSDRSIAGLFLKESGVMEVYDFGKGKNFLIPMDTVLNINFGGAYLSGNAQVKISAAT